MKRRDFLAGSALGLLTLSQSQGLALAQAAQDAPQAPMPSELSFDFKTLTDMMKAKAGQAFAPVAVELPGVIGELNYDKHHLIRYNPDKAVWRGQSDFELQAFHMGWLFKEPVRIHAVEDGKARAIGFSAADFIYQSPLDPAQFQNLQMPGAAGFRIHHPLNNDQGVMDELIAFLGASYFRALGKGSGYGLSARGLALNTATAQGEEFPRFTDFYIEKPGKGSEAIAVNAAMDSPSLTGAMRFVILPGDTTRIEVTARFFLRKDVERLGVAPLTSMFLFAGANRSAFDDYRGQVHDSEGLKIVRGNGEEIWRSLNNPKQLATSFFMEESPRAFGLFQRDRNFDNYQDAQSHYELRPSALIEPLSDWGKGSVCLIEIPSELEVNDNIVCFWTPAEPARAGAELEFSYRMSWGNVPEPTATFARVANFSAGAGGVSGIENEKGLRKFVIDFEGGALGNFPADSNVDPVVHISAGEVIHAAVSQIDGTKTWRLVLDIRPDAEKPAEISAWLAQENTALTESWAYQWRVGDEQRS